MTRSGDGWYPLATQVVLGEHCYTKGNVDRVGFCDHTADGFYTTLADPNFWNPKGESVHFGIGRNGEVCQLVNLFDTSHGQGRLGPTVTWPPYNDMGQRNPNGYLISIEHEDYVSVNGVSQHVPGSEWTQAEYAADLAVKRWCVAEVKRITGRDLLKYGIDSLAGHHMFDGVDRAECPGKFWRDDYHARLYQDLNQMETEMFVPHSAVSAFYANPDNQHFTGRVTPNARFDFGLPAGAKSLELEVIMQDGFELEVLHGKVTDPKNHKGHAWRTQGGYGHGRVVLDDDGSFTFGSDKQTAISLVGCTAYYM